MKNLPVILLLGSFIPAGIGLCQKNPTDLTKLLTFAAFMALGSIVAKFIK